MKLDCVILAAGNSSRFGSCKLLAEVQGQPLLVHSITAARSLNPAHIIIVGGAFYAELLQALPPLNAQAKTDADADADADCVVELLEFRAWSLGMGNSLAFAIKELQNANPLLILLGDQPLVSAQDLQHLYRTWLAQPEKIACASFANTLAVPAIFPANFKARLYACRGERGAKTILLNYREQVIPVLMPSAEFDVDTPADLSLYRKQ